MHNTKIKITIFTPTYNRCHTLARLYNSLKKQEQYTNYIEWLIVDDGSTDNTEDLIKSFQDEKIFNINYIKKENGGKHTALNIGIKNATGEYFFCIDSDDCLEDGAIETLFDFINTYNPDGIIAYKSDISTNSIIGDFFSPNLQETTLYSLINKHKCSGDRSLIYKTELLQQIYIPEPTGVKFFPETYLYDQFDIKHKSLLLNKSLCKCEYLLGGYSNSFRALMINNALSMKWFYGERLKMSLSFKERFIFTYRYIAFSLLAKSSEYVYKGRHFPHFIIAFPFGLIMYVFYLIKSIPKRKDFKSSDTN